MKLATKPLTGRVTVAGNPSVIVHVEYEERAPSVLASREVVDMRLFQPVPRPEAVW